MRRPNKPTTKKGNITVTPPENAVDVHAFILAGDTERFLKEPKPNFPIFDITGTTKGVRVDSGSFITLCKREKDKGALTRTYIQNFSKVTEEMLLTKEQKIKNISVKIHGEVVLEVTDHFSHPIREVFTYGSGALFAIVQRAHNECHQKGVNTLGSRTKELHGINGVQIGKLWAFKRFSSRLIGLGRAIMLYSSKKPLASIVEANKYYTEGEVELFQITKMEDIDVKLLWFLYKLTRHISKLEVEVKVA